MNTHRLESTRDCGNCMLCCKLPSIDELNKPEGIWCKHAKLALGCEIYSERPVPCREFRCFWLDHSSFDDEWKPNRAGFYMYIKEKTIFVIEDPGRPRAFSKKEYLVRLRIMADEISQIGGYLIIMNGKRGTLLLPNREISLGILSGVKEIRVQRVIRGNVNDYEVELVRGSSGSEIL